MIDVCDVVELRVDDRLVKGCNVRKIDDIDLIVRGDSKGVGLLGMPLNSTQRLNGMDSRTNA